MSRFVSISTLAIAAALAMTLLPVGSTSGFAATHGIHCGVGAARSPGVDCMRAARDARNGYVAPRMRDSLIDRGSIINRTVPDYVTPDWSHEYGRPESLPGESMYGR